jgi:hypothetical protein
VVDFTSLHRHNLISSACLVTVAISGQHARLMSIFTHIQGLGYRPKSVRHKRV